MKRALTITAAVALVCALAYLAWLNPARVELHLSPTYLILPPLAAALVFAFVFGAVLVLLALLIHGAGHSLREWWRGRHARRGERADSLEQQGEALLWAGETDRARTLLLRAWRHDPEHRRAALLAAASYLDDGDTAAAERLLHEALARHRADPELLLVLSNACARQGDRVGAIQALEQLRAHHPHAPRALIALRDQYVAADRWAEAVAVQSAYLRALRQPPLVMRERQRLIGLQYEAAIALPAPAERLAALERLVDSHPAFVPALVSLGDTLADSGRRSEALDVWQRALRTAPRTVFIERLLGHATEPAQRQSWRQLLRKLRAASVRPEAVRFWSARLGLIDGPASEALPEIDALANTLQGLAVFHQLRAEALRQLGHIDQAVREYASAERLAPAYVCGTCHGGTAAWRARCPHCANWDSFRATVEVAADV